MYFYSHDGQKVLEAGEAPWNEPGAVHAARDVRVTWFVRRYKLLAAMEAQASRLGITLHYGKNVVEYGEDETQGFATTSAGDRYSADLIVAADGVGTKSHKHITGVAPLPSSSGFAVLPRCNTHRTASWHKSGFQGQDILRFQTRVPNLPRVCCRLSWKELRRPNVFCMANRLLDPICT